MRKFQYVDKRSEKFYIFFLFLSIYDIRGAFISLCDGQLKNPHVQGIILQSLLTGTRRETLISTTLCQKLNK